MSIKQALQSITYKCVYAAFYVASLLPVRWLWWAANLIFLFIYYVLRYRRTVALQNIARSFPHKRYEEISDIAKKFYRNFSSHFADNIKALSVAPAILDKRIEFAGLELFDSSIASGQNVIACLGHCSNWELLNFMSCKVNHEIYAVYKPLSSHVMNRLMIRLRTRFGMKVITDRSVMRHIRSQNSSRAIYLFLADQCPQKNHEKFRYRFLNQDTYFFSGMEKLARNSNAAVIYLNIQQLSRQRYKVSCIPISAYASLQSEGEITKRYVELLEENIEEQLGSWLWTHKRWKR